MFNSIPFECVNLVNFTVENMKKVTTLPGESELLAMPKYQRMILEANIRGEKEVELSYLGSYLAAEVLKRLQAFGFTCSKIKSRTVKSDSVTRDTTKMFYFTVKW